MDKKSFYLLLLVFTFFSCKKEGGLTKLKILNSSVNIGDVKYGKTKDFTITLKNVGENDLLIEKIQPSCKCVIINDKKIKITPNETASIPLKYHAIEYGKSEESIVINSNTKEKFSLMTVSSNVIK